KHLFKATPTTGWWEGRSIVYPALLYGSTILFGYNELIIRIVNLLFGLGFTLSSYYLIKELFGRKYAVISGFITASQWVFLYWSLRITIGVPSALFLTLSALLFLKKDYKLNLLSGALLGLAFTIRFTAGIAGIAYLAYNLVSKKFRLKDYYWVIGVLIGAAPLMIYDLVVYANPLHSPLEFLRFNLSASGGSQAGSQFYYLMSMLVNYGLVMGLIVFLGFISLVFKLKNKKVLFTAIYLVTFISFYSLITSVKELRFLIHLLPLMAATSVLGANLIISSLVKRKRLVKYVLATVMVLIVIENLPSAYNNINAVKDSYLEVKQAGRFLRDYDGRVMSNSVPQITYYSENPTYNFPSNETAFIQEASDYSFVMVSAYESHPEYTYTLNHSFLVPIKAYPSPQDARLVIYQVQEQ
ncbi:hypothetical protein GF352_02960, partial [archaeon]|nr:hypothetical protein [archaeon]